VRDGLERIGPNKVNNLQVYGCGNFTPFCNLYAPFFRSLQRFFLYCKIGQLSGDRFCRPIRSDFLAGLPLTYLQIAIGAEMTNWISLKELLEKCKIPEFELIDYIKEGLTPYSSYNLQPISFPIEQHEYSRKINRLTEEIPKHRTALEHFIDFEKDVQEAKAKIIYTNKYNWKALRLVNKICDALYMYSIYSGNLEPQSENGYISISAGMIQKLKKVRQKYVNERERVEAEIHEIIKDEPNLKKDTQKSTKWKYFVKSENGEDIKKFISELIEKGAIFKREDVEGLNKDILKKKRANEIDHIIWHTGAEGEKLYEDVLARVKELGQTILSVSDEDLRGTAISAFKEKKGSFNFIKEKYVECPKSYEYVEKRWRKLIGSWIQKELKRHELKCSGGYGGAYDRYNKLKTKKVPTN
jgi:hypothetical protein